MTAPSSTRNLGCDLPLISHAACFQETDCSQPSGLWQRSSPTPEADTRSSHLSCLLAPLAKSTYVPILTAVAGTKFTHTRPSVADILGVKSVGLNETTQRHIFDKLFLFLIIYLYILNITLTYHCKIYSSVASVLTFSYPLNTEICFRLFSCHYAIF